MFLIHLYAQQIDKIFRKRRKCGLRRILDVLRLQHQEFYPLGKGNSALPVPPGAAIVKVGIEPFGELRRVDIVEEELLKQTFCHVDLRFHEIRKDVIQQLLRLEGNEEDVHLLRREVLERMHEHLELVRGFARLALDFFHRDLGRTLFFMDLLADHHAVFHVNDAVGINQVLRVMRHHDDRLLVDIVELLEDREHILSGFAVEVSDRLVGEDDIRIVDQGAGDSDALFLSARKLIGEFVRLCRDAETVQQPHALLATLRRAFSAKNLRQTDIVDDSERWDEIKSLKDHPDFRLVKLEFLLVGHGRERNALHGDVPVRGALQTRNGIKQRGFSAAGRTVDDDVFLGKNPQIGFLERPHLVRLSLIVDDAQFVDVDDGFDHNLFLFLSYAIIVPYIRIRKKVVYWNKLLTYKIKSMQSFAVRLSRKFLMGVLSLAAFVSAASVQAADAPAPTPPDQNAITVATVNVQDISLVKQDNNNLTIGFNISNREGVQPKIIYAVDLLQKDEKGNISLIDQKIYDNDILSLGTKDSVHKEVTYTAPAYLRGGYFVMVEARNPDGLVFGTVKVKNVITLDGTGEGLVVDSAGCVLTVDGETNSKRYILSQGVDISKDETLTAHCKISSTFKEEQTIVPSFQTRYRSAFGKIVDTKSQEPITIKSGQSIDFTAKLPKMTDPQAYDAILTFKSGMGDPPASSLPVTFHYVLRGQSATIQNLTLDKDYYRAGDIAKAVFFWSGSADSFPGSRLGTAEGEKAIAATFSIIDGEKKACIEPLTKNLNVESTGGVEKIDIPMTSDCVNPSITVAIKDIDNKVLAENVYDVPSKSFAGANVSIDDEENPILPIVLFSTFLLIAALGIYLVKKNKHSGIAMIFGLMISCGVLTSGSDASADTFFFATSYYPHAGTVLNSSYSVNLDKSEYIINEPIDVSGTFSSAVCTNGVNVTGATIENLSVTINEQTQSLISGSSVATNSKIFTAQSVAGNYTAIAHATSVFSGYGGATESSMPYTVVQPVDLNLSFSPLRVPSGGTSRLHWDAKGATSCQKLDAGDNNWSATSALFGSFLDPSVNQADSVAFFNAIKNYDYTKLPPTHDFDFENITQDITVTLTCVNTSGETVTREATVTVAPAPTLDFTLAPSTGIATGGASHLHWSATNADYCSLINASGVVNGQDFSQLNMSDFLFLPTTGDVDYTNITSDISLTLKCTGVGGDVQKTATATLAPSASASTLKICDGSVLVANSLSIDPGTPKVLTAKYGTATDCNDTDVTSSTTWTSSNTSVVTASATQKGTITGINLSTTNPATATVTATYSGQQQPVNVTVRAASAPICSKTTGAVSCGVYSETEAQACSSAGACDGAMTTRTNTCTHTYSHAPAGCTPTDGLSFSGSEFDSSTEEPVTCHNLCPATSKWKEIAPIN